MYNLIEDYLERLSLPLVRRLPYHERQRIRQELRDHLLERVDELKAQGVSDDEAVMLALKQFGQPEWVGTLILEKRTPLPRLSWWRAVVLLLVVVVGSFALVPANYRTEQDMRQPQVVDVILWTAGDKAVLANSSRSLREALMVIEYSSFVNNRPLPPQSTTRPVQDPSLHSLVQMIEQHYGKWAYEVTQIRPDRPAVIIEEWQQRLGNRYVWTVPDSVCAGMTGCFSTQRTLPNEAVALQVAATMLACAVAAGVVMRQRRWVAAVLAAVTLVSLAWSVALVAQLNRERSFSRDFLLTQIVDSLEQTAIRQPRLILSSPPRIPISVMGMESNEQRPLRIQQLARLYRLYEADYNRSWQEWRQAGIAGQTWRMFRAYVVPAWWIVPVALIAAIAGGWLGIALGTWAWRLRSYLVYRYA